MRPERIKAEVELSKDRETYWLHFKMASGRQAAINLMGTPFRQRYFEEWAEEQLKKHEPPMFPNTCQFGDCQVALPEGVMFCDRHE